MSGQNRRVPNRDLFDFWLDGKPGNMLKRESVKLANFRPEFGAYLAFFNIEKGNRVTYERGVKSPHPRIGRRSAARRLVQPAEVRR